jgi:GcrA cell cycle regulator
MNGMDSIWTPESIKVLRSLWSEGHTATEIGNRMGLNKNQVIGKVHRLNLTQRPSPLGVAKNAAVKKATATRAAKFKEAIENEYRFKSP